MHCIAANEFARDILVRDTAVKMTSGQKSTHFRCSKIGAWDSAIQFYNPELSVGFAIEKDICFAFLLRVPINIGIKPANIKTGVQIKQTGSRIVVLTLCIKPTISVLRGNLFCFLDQHLSNMLSTIFSTHLQIIQVHILEKPRLQNC